MCSDSSTQLPPEHALSVVIILEGEHGRDLALLNIIPVAIETCGISSSLFVVNTTGTFHL